MRELSLKQLLLVGLCLVLSVLVGCDSSTGPSAPRDPFGGTPRVTGIWVTDSEGTVIAACGDPSEGGARAYPNPFWPVCQISFEVPAITAVKVWVVRALGPNEPEEEDELLNAAGAVVVAPGGAAAQILVDAPMEPGVHSIVWDGRDDGGRQLPSGFYRIYVMAGGLTWVDVLSARDCSDIPPGMPTEGGCG